LHLTWTADTAAVQHSMLAAQAAGPAMLANQPLRPLQAPQCVVRLQCLSLAASPSLVQRCPNPRSGPPPCIVPATTRVRATCERAASRVVPRAIGTAERTASYQATAEWRSEQPALEGSWDERWSQADTAAAAAAVWRQRPGEHAQQAHVNGHGSGGSAAETEAHGDAMAASSPLATSGHQADGARDAWPSTSSSEQLLTPDHVSASDSSSGNGASAATTLGPVNNARRQAEYARNRERRRSKWADSDLSEGELQRRINISNSRAGRAPWNKGLGEVGDALGLLPSCWTLIRQYLAQLEHCMLKP
jgi:hypothetical protein